jgi:hypothetical protein
MKKTRKTPTLRELFKDNPGMVEATGEFQAIILGHGRNAPKMGDSPAMAAGKRRLQKVKITPM